MMGTRCRTKEAFRKLLEEGFEQNINICRNLASEHRLRTSAVLKKMCACSYFFRTQHAGF